MADMGKIDIVRVGVKISTTCHSTTKLSAVVLLKCYPAVTVVIIVKVHMQLELKRAATIVLMKFE